MKINQINDKIEQVKVAQENNNGFTTESKVSVYVNMNDADSRVYDFDYEKKVRVSFLIDDEWRSWGLKAARVVVTNISPIRVDITRTNDKTFDEEIAKTFEIRLDAFKLHQTVEKAEGTGVTVGELDISVDINGVVDYSKSNIVVYQL